MKFNSKKDWWLTVIVWGAMLYSIGSGIYGLIIMTPNAAIFFVTLSLSVLLPIFILWLWCNTFYVLDEKDLIIHVGPFTKKIPLESITSARKTNNPLSSPALSLKRLEIAYGRYHMILISPEDRDEFLTILSKRCPHIRIITHSI